MALAHVMVVRKAIVRDAWISPVALTNLAWQTTAVKVVVIAMTKLSTSAPSAKRRWVAPNACLSGI